MSEIEVNAAAPATTGSKRTLVIALVAIVVVAGGAAAAWFGGFLGSADGDERATRLPPPIYHDIDSNLVVNFQGGGRARYLQIGVQAMARDPAVIESLKQHHPLIRNNLILLFSDQSHEQLSTREGKAALAAEALAEVQAILTEQHGAAGVEAVYFTTFVMQ